MPVQKKSGNLLNTPHIYISSSSSSIQADSTNSHDSLLSSIPISFLSKLILETASSVRTELIYISFCQSANSSVSMSPQDNIAYEFNPATQAVSCMSKFMLRPKPPVSFSNLCSGDLAWVDVDYLLTLH